RATLENLFESLAEGQKKVLHIVLKADVQGSLEAIIGALREIKTNKINLGIIHAAVGPISDSDVLLASASDAVIIGFNVKVEASAVGWIVVDGRIARGGRARVLRNRQPVYDGGIATLRRFQDEVKEVRNGLECGIKLGDFNEYQVGDIIECYQLEKIAQKL